MKPETVFLIPQENLIVRDPQTGEPLPTTGKQVVMSGYWQRRINDGDVAYREVGGRATQDAKADAYREVDGRATQEAGADNDNKGKSKMVKSNDKPKPEKK